MKILDQDLETKVKRRALLKNFQTLKSYIRLWKFDHNECVLEESDSGIFKIKNGSECVFYSNNSNDYHIAQILTKQQILKYVTAYIERLKNEDS